MNDGEGAGWQCSNCDESGVWIDGVPWYDPEAHPLPEPPPDDASGADSLALRVAALEKRNQGLLGALERIDHPDNISNVSRKIAHDALCDERSNPQVSVGQHWHDETKYLWRVVAVTDEFAFVRHPNSKGAPTQVLLAWSRLHRLTVAGRSFRERERD
jgi:hypothetical protein